MYFANYTQTLKGFYRLDPATHWQDYVLKTDPFTTLDLQEVIDRLYSR